MQDTSTSRVYRATLCAFGSGISNGARVIVGTGMQRENERGRVAVNATRTDGGQRCTLVVVYEVGGTWALYPHGAGQLGARLAKAQAVRMAQAILDGAR